MTPSPLGVNVIEYYRILMMIRFNLIIQFILDSSLIVIEHRPQRPYPHSCDISDTALMLLLPLHQPRLCLWLCVFLHIICLCPLLHEPSPTPSSPSSSSSSSWSSHQILVSAATIDEVFESTENRLHEFSKVIVDLYHRRCSAQCPTTSDKCAQSAREGNLGSSPLSSLQCSSLYGRAPENLDTCAASVEERQLDTTTSVIRSAHFPDSSLYNEKDVLNSACWTQGMDVVWKNASETDATSRWMYFGTPSGFYRIFPGLSQQHCNTYDNRIRPW